MTDPRPSENTDTPHVRDAFPEMYRRFAGAPFDDDPIFAVEEDPIDHRAEAVELVDHNDPLGLASVHALIYVGDQLARIADVIGNLHIDVDLGSES